LPEIHDDPEDDFISIERIVGLVARRRWWIVATASSVAVATIGTVWLLPNCYRSESTLVVVQQQVSQRFVLPDSTTTNADLFQVMTQEVLSRTRLLGIIDEFGLYAEQKRVLAPDLLVELMRKDIDIQALDQNQQHDFTTFKISFTAGNPHLAREVTSRLTSLFIQENLKRRSAQAASTTNFLSEQLEAARQKLAEQDQHLRDFKLRNLGQLPEQQSANFGALTELRMQLQSTIADLSKAQQQRESLESSITDKLTRLQSERDSLLIRFTPRHAEVIKKDLEISKTQAWLEGLKTGTLITNKLQDQVAPDDFSALLNRKIEASVVEIENLSKEEKRLKAEIARYQAHLDLTPLREQELAVLLRDKELFSHNYTDLLTKKLESQLTTNVEERQEGQQFRLVDPPTLPAVPSSPKRAKISLGGLAAGILLGFALAVMVDHTDHSFHTEKDLSHLFKVPLILGVPLLLTPPEKRARNWKRALEWLAGCVITLAVSAAEFYVYRHG
jgi:succinoglycan biosynthesis transport protein ExoP